MQENKEKCTQCSKYVKKDGEMKCVKYEKILESVEKPDWCTYSKTKLNEEI